MIKSELQVGYLVQTRNKNLYMVMPFVDYDEVKLCFRHSDKNGILFSDEYLMNLNHKLYNDSDIVKVYGFSENALNTLMFDTDSRKLLWERKEEKENQSSKNDSKDSFIELCKIERENLEKIFDFLKVAEPLINENKFGVIINLIIERVYGKEALKEISMYSYADYLKEKYKDKTGGENK